MQRTISFPHVSKFLRSQHLKSLFIDQCITCPLRVHVENGVIIFLFGRQPNHGHLNKITETFDVDYPFITGLVRPGVCRIGTEQSDYLLFEGKRK